MFGFFRKRKPAEPDRSTIVPRIKHTNFVSCLADTGVPPEQFPVTEPLVGDLLVTYAFDLPHMFQMVMQHDMTRLSLVPEEMRVIAIENLSRGIPEVSVQKSGPLMRVVTGNDLEACTLLAARLWNKLAGQVRGELVVSVPSRSDVLICGSESKEGLQRMRELATQVLQNESTHGLTEKLLTWRNGKWELYGE